MSKINQLLAQIVREADRNKMCEHHLEDGVLYEYEAIDSEIHLFTGSVESVVLTKEDLELMLALIDAE